ncbi:MAG: T9SS type A sorting domain-containing protein [Bacteroidota bacterium]
MNYLPFFSKANTPLSFLATLLILFLLLPSSKAENVITTGTTLKVLPGTSLVSIENLVIKSGATLNNSGTLILKKNLINENVSPNSLGTGTAEFSGTTGQTISGQNIITNLTANNATGLTIGDNTRVNGNLTLTSGTITLGSDNLVLGPLAAILGAPSASVMIIVTSSGELRKEFPAGFTGTFTYPVGDDTGTQEYSPVTLVFTSGTFTAGNYVGICLNNEMYPDPNITGNYLNRYWNLTHSGITGLICNATFQYLLADVIGTESKLSCTKVNPLPWVTYGSTNATLHLLSANGLTSFGSYTGLKSTTTPLNQELANVIIPNGTTTCYDAQQILTVAGGGNTFLVENNGYVTLVAGLKISMLDGTKVNSGGYLRGYITTTSTFCGTMFAPLVANNQNEQSLGVETVVKNQFIKVYPNPTTDIVIVELMEAGLATVANVTVYSMQGGKLLQKTINGESKLQFSLLGKPVGIYMVHVQSGDRSEIAKVVKN